MTANDRRAITSYLNQVRKHSGDRTAEEQTELVRQLEEHIYESMAAGEGASAEDVIARMDPPESFGEPDRDGDDAPTVAGRLTLGQWSLIVLGSGVAIPFILMALSEIIRGTIGSIFNIGGPLGILLVVVALGMGIAARKEPAGKATIIASSIILVLLSLVAPVRRVTSSARPEGEAGEMRIEATSEQGDE